MSFGAGARRSDVPLRPTKTTVVLVCGDAEVASWPLGGGTRCDVSLIDELARLQLAARRLGCSIRLREPCGQLWELLDLAGLTDVVTSAGGLVVEVGGETEGGEEVGVEEGVEPGDPVA
jgi:hypothetical protein